MSLLSAIAFVLGLLLLVVGAELFVRGASRMGLLMGVSPLVIGLTVVAYGTSSPELAVSVGSVLRGSDDIALGNVVGSNICNVLLILGLSSLAAPLGVSRQLVRWDVPLMIGVSLLLLLMSLDGRIGRLDGAILVVGCLVYTAWTIRASRKETLQAFVLPEGAEAIPRMRSRGLRWLFSMAAAAGGFGVLLLGANWVVKGAVDIARLLGMSELVIGLTIVAIGTSLPEIATSVVAGIRGQRDIAVGNVVGSNIFNILLVAGLAAAVSPVGLQVKADALRFDLPVMVAVAAACLPIFITGGVLSRSEGVFFLIYYACYTGYLFFNASHHRTVGPFDAAAMIFIVAPLVVGGVLSARFLLRRVCKPPA